MRMIDSTACAFMSCGSHTSYPIKDKKICMLYGFQMQTGIGKECLTLGDQLNKLQYIHTNHSSFSSH